MYVKEYNCSHQDVFASTSNSETKQKGKNPEMSFHYSFKCSYKINSMT